MVRLIYFMRDEFVDSASALKGCGFLLDLADGAPCWPSGANQCFLPVQQYFPVQINKGEHGFDNQEMDMKPFFRAVGPVFHKNLEVGPFETVNIYPLMCHILGIRPEVNDGHLNATKHMLVSSTGEFLRTAAADRRTCSLVKVAPVSYGMKLLRS